MWRVGPESTWTTVLPVAFIIVSLVSLVVLPIVVENRTAKMRSEISRAAEPARRTANEMQRDLAAEIDKIIAYQVTGQEQFRSSYEALLSGQRRRAEILKHFAPNLGGDVPKQLDLLISGTNRWHATVRNAEFLSRSMPHEVFMTRLFEQHPQYEEVIAAASALEVAIQDAIDERLQRIRDAERLNLSLTIILTLLALTSALLVAGLGRQMRLLAAEAMRRRQEAEREAADAKIAREAAEREERRAAFVAAAGQELTASLDMQETIERLARLIVPNLAEACAIELAESETTLRRAAIAHRDAEKEKELLPSVGRELADIPAPIGSVMHERDVKIVGGASPLADFFDGGSHPRSLMIVPLVSRGETLGVVMATAPEGQVFTRDDAALAAEVARRGSLAIDNARLYQNAQEAIRAREEVLAIVSHDLRNPLNAVMLATSLLKMSAEIDADEREQLDAVDVSAQRMKRLIEDLLDVTRVEGGQRLSIDPDRIDIESLFNETYELFKSQATTSSITLHHAVAPGVPPVYADRHRVIQVLSNLIGNALKFTPEGGMVTFRAEPQDGFVLFTVADTGPGIPRENLDKIFNPYWQAKRTARLGAGLGLPIAKGIVESHGGRIWVESAPGEGTKFYFTLQVAREEEARRPAAESASRR